MDDPLANEPAAPVLAVGQKLPYIGNIPGSKCKFWRDGTIIAIEQGYVKISAVPSWGKHFHDFWVEKKVIEGAFQFDKELGDTLRRKKRGKRK